jgi:tetratricopeptide (TPR) repeat protein
VLVLEDLPTDVDRLFFSPHGHKLFAIHGEQHWHVWDATPLADDILYGRLTGKRIEELADKVGLKEEMRVRLKSDPGLTEAARRVALRRLENYEETSEKLNMASWEVASKPGAPPENYRLALRQAERACELDPKEQAYVNALGVAKYRVGQYRKALTNLQKSLSMGTKERRAADFEDLAFLAMTYHQLGEAAQARAYLQRLRALGKQQPEVAANSEYISFLREAEMLIEGK